MPKKYKPVHEMVRERESGTCMTCKHGYFDPDEYRWLCSCRDSDSYGMAVESWNTCKEWEKDG